jgi:hypothetical protein
MLGLPSQALAWYCKTQTTQDMEALMVQYIRTVAFLKHLFLMFRHEFGHSISQTSGLPF